MPGKSSKSSKSRNAELFVARKSKSIPFAFVLDEIADLKPWTRPLFGCTAVYVDDKVVLALREGKEDADNGVWLATTKEHHAALHAELPSLRSITVFGSGDSGWRVLPATSDDFESSVLHVCGLLRRRDPRIGKVPGAKRKSVKKR